MPASQDYRDGASTATHELRTRLITGLDWGFPIDRKTIESVSEEVCELYGGNVDRPPFAVTLTHDEIETALRMEPNLALSMGEYDALARRVGTALDSKLAVTERTDAGNG